MKTFVSFARYGLIRLPKKSKDAAAPIKKASIFDSDSDEVGSVIPSVEILYNNEVLDEGT